MQAELDRSDRALKAVRKPPADIEKDRRSAAWKIVIVYRLAATTAPNGWIAEAGIGTG